MFRPHSVIFIFFIVTHVLGTRAGLLVHDNLFNVDNDSHEKSLNYLHLQAENHPGEFQYILTLNRETVETMEAKSLLKFKIEDYERARFTKNDRFLGKHYSEQKRKR
jgi:hypothetical protein